MSGDQRYHEAEYQNVLSLRDAAVRERDAAIRERDAAIRERNAAIAARGVPGSAIHDVTIRDPYGFETLEVRVTD